MPGDIADVAKTAVEGFKNNPACLAAILLAGAFGVLTFYGLQRDADRRSKTVDLLMERCFPSADSEGPKE